jgi:hypothetical protein
MAQQPSRHTVEWIKKQAIEAGGGWEAARKARKPRPKPLPHWLTTCRFGQIYYKTHWMSFCKMIQLSDSIPERIPLPGSRDGLSMASDPREGNGNAAQPSLEVLDCDDIFILPLSILLLLLLLPLLR